jgi:hypothetical protein
MNVSLNKQTKSIYLLRLVGEAHSSFVLGSVVIPQQMEIGGELLFTQCPYDKYPFLIVVAALVQTCVGPVMLSLRHLVVSVHSV